MPAFVYNVQTDNGQTIHVFRNKDCADAYASNVMRASTLKLIVAPMLINARHGKAASTMGTKLFRVAIGAKQVDTIQLVGDEPDLFNNKDAIDVLAHDARSATNIACHMNIELMMKASESDV